MTRLEVDNIPAPLAGLLLEVAWEYRRAKEKHGDMTLDGPKATLAHRLACLMEEVGEVARACTYDEGDPHALRVELIQVANVALTWATAVPG